MFYRVVELLKNKHIDYEKGLSSLELEEIESRYNIKFPTQLKDFYKVVLPISKGFYNWRDSSQTNINAIKTAINSPFNSILENLNDVEWSDKWGKEPRNQQKRNEIVRIYMSNAPKLIPIYSHRYVAESKEIFSSVISVCGTDVIYYGKDLCDYYYNEFNCLPEKLYMLREMEYIPFWTDIMG